jgi:hypothetical protein
VVTAPVTAYIIPDTNFSGIKIYQVGILSSLNDVKLQDAALSGIVGVTRSAVCRSSAVSGAVKVSLTLHLATYDLSRTHSLSLIISRILRLHPSLLCRYTHPYTRRTATSMLTFTCSLWKPSNYWASTSRLDVPSPYRATRQSTRTTPR